MAGLFIETCSQSNQYSRGVDPEPKFFIPTISALQLLYLVFC